MVVVPRRVVTRFHRFSLYNSPYPAHDTGAAIDLYPEPGTGIAESPVAGTVVETRSVRAPQRPGANPRDFLVVVDTGSSMARILHVDPWVGAGDELGRGDVVGELITSGYAAPWVPDHLHLGFREAGADLLRATGSQRLSVDVSPTGVGWDGTGTVVDSADTYVVLDAPTAPDDAAGFVGIEAGSGGVLDGGFPHYSGGGLFGGGDGRVQFLGTQIGSATDRDVRWAPVTVLANDDPILGISFSIGRDGRGVKLVCPNRMFAAGEAVTVTIESGA